MKTAENLQTDCLAIFRSRVLSADEGSLADEIMKNIVAIIVGDAVIVIVLAVEPLLLAEAVDGHFSLQVAENTTDKLAK